MTLSIEAAATLSFARMVEAVRAIAPPDGRARRVDRLPDGRTSLVFRVHAPGRGDVTVLGPRSRALLKDAPGFVLAIAIQIKPGWATALLGVPASELTDAYVPLDRLWGRAPASDLTDDLLGATNVDEVLGLITRAFASRPAPIEPTSAPLARRAAALLEAGESRVDGVAARLGVTTRHLRRAFAENIGVAPKDFVRSTRLQRAVRLAGTRSWTRIASDAGYYDQAHLIADFHDLVGLTPSDYAKRTRQLDPPAPLDAMTT